MKMLVFSLACTLAMVGFVVADEFDATIRKIDGNTVHFTKGKKGDEKEGLAVAVDDAKVNWGTKGKKGETVTLGEVIEKGLKNDMFAKIGDDGIPVQITTDDMGRITQVLAYKGGEQKDDKKAKADKKGGKKKG